MKKVLMIFAFVITAFAGNGGIITGNVGPLTNGNYYKTVTADPQGQQYIGYIAVTADGHIYRCNANGYSNASQTVKLTIESNNDRIASMTWMAESEVWTEIQTMHIMRDDNAGTREINIWRSVTNVNGTAWATYYTGILTNMGAIPTN